MGLAIFSFTGTAEQLIIASRGDADTLDPHMRNEIWTMSIQDHFNECLVTFSSDGAVIPKLAEAWSFIDDETWEFNLRQGVVFHNGEIFNADVVVYNIERIRNNPMSQFKAYVDPIVEVEIVDDYTVRFKTNGPLPTLPNFLCSCSMVPPLYTEEHGDEYFASHPIGTGPYQLVEWVKDDHMTLHVNENYWGELPTYDEVIFRPIPVGATRVAALLSGEVDVIEAVPVFDISRVEAAEGIRVERRPSLRVIFLLFDVGRAMGGEAPDNSPGVAAGEPNPVADVRVRQAIYHAINIEDIRDYVMEGSSYPWSQPMPDVILGYNPEVERLPYDLDLARQLLAEAGYADGFKIRLDCPNDRYINDQEIAEAISGQLAEIGIEVEVNAVPKAVFFPQVFTGRTTSFSLSGWAEPSMDAGGLLSINFSSEGEFNNGFYRNEDVDRLIAEALVTMDLEARESLYQEVVKIIMDDVAWIPVHLQENVFGVSDGIVWSPRFDERIHAFDMSN